MFRPTRNIALVIDGNNDGAWDFGYQTYLPTVVIDGLRVIDDRLRRNDNALRLFGQFEQTYDARFRIIRPEGIFITNLVRDSGYGFIISLNTDGKFENIAMIIHEAEL